MKTNNKGRSLRKALNTFGSFRVTEFSRSSKAKLAQRGEVYILDSFKVGDRRLFKHKHGHVLASEKILKPIIHELRGFFMFGCEEVKYERRLDYTLTSAKALDVGILEEAHENIKTIRKSARESIAANSDAGSVFSKSVANKQFRKRLSEKGNGFFLMNNNHLLIFSPKAVRNAQQKSGRLASSPSLAGGSAQSLNFRQPNNQPRISLEPSRRFSWAHIYAIEREAGSSEFQAIFYAYLDEDNLPVEGHFSSKAFQFQVLTIKCKDVDEATEVMTLMYKAVEGQAIMCTNTAGTLEQSSDKTQAEAAEEFLRLSIDLWALNETCVSQKVIDAQKKLITYLDTHNDPDKESAFWKDRTKELEDKLSNLDTAGQAVDGIQI